MQYGSGYNSEYGLYGSEQHSFKRRDSLPSGLGLTWQIDAGVVRALTWDESGSVVTLGFWGAGDIVGQPLSQIQPYQIECLTRVKASILSGDYWYPQKAMLAHIQQTEELLKIVRGGRVVNRLLQFLHWLGRRFGCQGDQGQLLELQLTHQDIADAIGTTRVSVTRLLSELEREGKIGRSPHNRILLPGKPQCTG